MKHNNRLWSVAVEGPTGRWTEEAWAETPALAAEEVLLRHRDRGVAVKIGDIIEAKPGVSEP